MPNTSDSLTRLVKQATEAFQSGSFNMAKKFALEGLEIQKQNVQLLNILARIALVEEQPEVGIKLLKLVLKIDATNFDAFNNLSVALGRARSTKNQHILPLLLPILTIHYSSHSMQWDKVVSCFNNLSFHNDGKAEWLECVFEEIGLALVKHFCSLKLYDLALALETELYSRFVKMY
jgi:hypothetical protein